jgi:virulence-associated protein VapD
MSARTFDINKTKLFGNVRVINQGDKISVILHSSEVFRFDKVQNKVYVSSHGWKTPTTKTAINNALKQLESITGQSMPSVFQKKGEWFLTNGQKFEDGMELAVYPLLQALA